MTTKQKSNKKFYTYQLDCLSALLTRKQHYSIKIRNISDYIRFNLIEKE